MRINPAVLQPERESQGIRLVSGKVIDAATVESAR